MQHLKTQVCVIGGGPAGYSAAVTAARQGARVVLIEKDRLGGPMLTYGGIPAKVLLKTAQALSVLTHADEPGAVSDGAQPPVSALSPLLERSDALAKTLRDQMARQLKSCGVRVLHGEGSIESQGLVVAKSCEGATLVSCERIIVATGSEHFLPPVEGAALPGVLTFADVKKLKAPPKSLVIIGSDALGMEFAEFFCALGTRVTVTEQASKILPGMDSDLAETLEKSLLRRTAGFLTGARVTKIRRTEEGLETTVESEGGRVFLHTENVLFASGYGLSGSAKDILSAGIRTEHGAIVVDGAMQTNVDGIYAAGDVTGARRLSHLAAQAGRAAAGSALGLLTRVDDKAVPVCVATSPEIAAVGLCEDEARAKRIRIKVGRAYFEDNPKALGGGSACGFVKVVADETGRLLGAGIIGAAASELIGELTLAVSRGLPVEAVAGVMHAPFSLSQTIADACADACARAASLRKGERREITA